MKYKLYLFTCIIIISLTIINSCNPGCTQPEVVFWALPNAPNDIHVAWMKQKGEDFMMKTGIAVKFEELSWGDSWGRIIRALDTGEGADVFQVGSTWNSQFAATGGLEQLSINDFGGESLFYKGNLDTCKYDNKYYGVPWLAETRCLFYNKDVFEELELTPPETYDDIIEVSERIIKKRGKGTAISVAGTTAWDLIHNWSIILWANGGEILNYNNTKAVFNSEKGIKSMEWYLKLIEMGYAAEACSEYNQPQADASFINGNTAMCFMGPWNINIIRNDNPNLKYGVLEPPYGESGRAAYAGGSNLVILKESVDKKKAKKWIKYLLEEKNLVDYTKNLSHMLPVKISAFNDPYYQTENFQVFKNTLEYARAYPQIGEWGYVETIIVDEYKNILADYVNSGGDKEIKDYIKKAEEKVNEILEKKQKIRKNK